MLLALVRCKGPTKHIEIPLILNNRLLNVLREHYNKTLGKPIVTGTRGWWRVQVIGRRLYLGCKCRPRLSRPSNNPQCCYMLPVTRQETYEILFQLSTDIESFNFLPHCWRSGWLDKWTMLRKKLHFPFDSVDYFYAFLSGWNDQRSRRYMIVTIVQNAL